jgi:trimethylamine---corrinoid protein Co-methyltransferase
MEFRFFSDKELADVEGASFDILETIGIRTSSERLKTILGDAGCRIDNDTIRFPLDVIERHIQKCPQTVTIHGRDHSSRVVIGGEAVYTQTCVGTPSVLDLESGQKRPCQLADVTALARLADGLPAIDIISPAFPLDVPDECVVTSQVVALLKGTAKPLRLALESANEFDTIFEILAIMAGGRSALQAAPLAYLEISPISPLEYGPEAAEALFRIVNSGLPLGIIPAVMMGASGPMTLAGCVAMHHAEILAGVVASQAIRPGAPVIMSPRATTMDMISGLGLWAMPETGMMAAASAQLCRRAGIPCTTNGFTSSAKVADSQAAYEHLYNALIPALSGSNVIVAAGSLNNVLISCYKMLVIDNEIASVVKRTLAPCEVSEDSLAVQVIADVRAGRDQFLGHEHTFAHLRDPGSWIPPIGDRQNFEQWAANPEKLEEKAGREARHILDTHRPHPISEKVLAELDRIVALSTAEKTNAGKSSVCGS